MPLFEVVGVAPTGKIFTVAFVFLKNEKEDSYTWALEHLKLLIDSDDFPKAIVTDRELALVNALKNIFHSSYHILCRRHIGKDVEKYFTNLVKNKDIGTSFSQGRWHKVVEAQTQQEYEDQLGEMNEAYSHMFGLLKYVHETWLGPFKERFVRAWTNCALHMGQLTTNRYFIFLICNVY